MIKKIIILISILSFLIVSVGCSMYDGEATVEKYYGALRNNLQEAWHVYAFKTKVGNIVYGAISTTVGTTFLNLNDEVDIALSDEVAIIFKKYKYEKGYFVKYETKVYVLDKLLIIKRKK